MQTTFKNITLLVGMVISFHAFSQEYVWPSVSISPFAHVRSQIPSYGFGTTGVVLSDGNFFGIGNHATDVSNPWALFLKKITPNGQTLFSKRFSFQFPQVLGTRLRYDRDHQRVFLHQRFCQRAGYGGLFWNNPEQVAAAVSFLPRDVVICLDTAGEVIWSKKVVFPFDSLGSISACEPDGTGGLFVAGQCLGSVSQAVALGVEGTLLRGYYYLTRFDRNGVQRWTLRVPDPVGAFENYKQAGFSQFLSQKPLTTDWLMYYVDPANIPFVNFNPANPLSLLVRRCRVDTNGQISRQFESPLNGRYAPNWEIGHYFFKQPKNGNGNRHLLYLQDGIRQPNAGGSWIENSALMELDSNFAITRLVRLPTKNYANDLTVGPAGDIVVEGIDPMTNRKLNYLVLDPETFQLRKALAFRSNCDLSTQTNPHLFTIPRANQPDSSDLLILGPTSAPFPYSQDQSLFFRLNARFDPPCVAITTDNQAFAPIQDVTGESVFNWQPADILAKKGRWNSWSDTVLAPPGFAPNRPLVDVCQVGGISNGFGPPITVCADSVRLTLSDLLFTMDSDFIQPLLEVTWSNGAKNQRSILVTESGMYKVTLTDSCASFRTYQDSIRVTLRKDLKIRLPEDFSLCPGASRTPVVPALPELQYTWTPTRGLNNPFLAQPTFLADSMPKGWNTFVLTTRFNGTCPASDTLRIFNSPGPQAQIRTSQPDSLLWLQPSMLNLQWTVNGGFFQSETQADTVGIRWAPWFEGQQAGVGFEDSLGCIGRLTYLRPKPAVVPPDTMVPPPLPEIKALFIPNLVVKNGDNQNEQFRIGNQQESDVVELEIYNRWGRQVYASSRYRGEFPENQPAGVYFAKLRISGIRNGKLLQEDHQTWITVMRP